MAKLISSSGYSSQYNQNQDIISKPRTFIKGKSATMLRDKLKLFPLYDVFINPKDYSVALLITFVSLLVMSFEPTSIEWLRYQPVEVTGGQWWRIFTANLCHSNWNHWMLNIAGLWLMDLFYQPVLSHKTRAGLLIFCMLLNVVMLHFMMKITWYVGLSGALHGYLIGGALLSWNKAKLLNFAIVAITTIKLITESVWQINTATEALIGANVLEEAHSFGAISAVVFWLFTILYSKIKKPLAN